MMMPRVFAMLSVCALAACGGSPFDFDEPTPFGPISSDEAAALVTSYDALSGQILALPPTPTGGMDNSGRATFTGLTQMTVTPEAGSDSMTLVGDATLIANFDRTAITANMNNFAGVDVNGMAQRFDGGLMMDNGSIGLSTPNGISGNFRGRLVADTYEIRADGILEGTFRGTPAVALSFTGLDDTALLDGERASISLSGIAQE